MLFKKLLDEKGEITVEYAILIGIFGFLGFVILNFTLRTLGASFIDAYQRINSPKP